MELEEWWKQTGHDLLFGGAANEAPEDEDSEEEDEEDLIEPDAGVPEEEAETKCLQDDLDSTKHALVLKSELKKFDDDPDFEGDNDEKPADPAESDSEEEMEESDGEAAGTVSSLDPKSVKTLEDVLTQAKFKDFEPCKDHEAKTLQRIRALTPSIRNLVAFTRVNENVLSTASVMKIRKGENAHNVAQQQLAQARQAFQCSSERQSRHQQWFKFSERTVADVQEGLGSSNGPDAASVPKVLGPSTTLSDEHGRRFQLLVVRPLLSGATSGGLRFAIPVAAWRAGRLKKNVKKAQSQGQVKSNGQKLLPAGQLPVHMITAVHVQLLMPWESAGIFNTFIGSWRGFDLQLFCSHIFQYFFMCFMFSVVFCKILQSPTFDSPGPSLRLCRWMLKMDPSCMKSRVKSMNWL